MHEDERVSLHRGASVLRCVASACMPSPSLFIILYMAITEHRREVRSTVSCSPQLRNLGSALGMAWGGEGDGRVDVR